MEDPLDTSDLNLGAVNTADELAGALKTVHVRAGAPSMRALETITRRSATPLSKTVASEMLRGVRFPTQAVMVTFLRASGVKDDGIGPWLHAWERVKAGVGVPNPRVPGLWRFSDSGPVTLICAELPKNQASPLADPANPNYTELLAYADLDSLQELYGHIRAENPTMGVYRRLSSRFEPEDLSGHVVLIGGIGWNSITGRILKMSRLPVRQIEDSEVPTGEIFAVDSDGKEERYLPKWTADSELEEDVGLIARMTNPLNSARSLTICNGIHSRGVLGAVRTLTDAQLRKPNETYIVENFEDIKNFAILMRVSVINRKTMTPDFNDDNCILYQWPS